MPLSGRLISDKPIVEIGKLDHMIQIVQPSTTQDASGGLNVSVNTPVLTCWAAIRELTAEEKFAAHEFASLVSHFIFIRHPRSAVPQGITAKMQVQWNSRQFQIEDVQDPDRKQTMLRLVCIEIDDSANQQGALPESQL